MQFPSDLKSTIIEGQCVFSYDYNILRILFIERQYVNIANEKSSSNLNFSCFKWYSFSIYFWPTKIWNIANILALKISGISISVCLTLISRPPPSFCYAEHYNCSFCLMVRVGWGTFFWHIILLRKMSLLVCIVDFWFSAN